MIPSKSLALYKNRPVLVLERREDKLEIRLEDGSTIKVRDKDLEALHPGPITTLPAPAAGGDFETARRMLEPDPETNATPLPYRELAELVFGVAGPAETLAAFEEALLGLRFKPDKGGALPLSDAELARELERRARKESEAAEREDFVLRAKKARSAKPGQTEAFRAEDERFLGEIEALAMGKSAKSKLAQEIGISEEAEAAQAFLLRTGRWDESVNPHPSRSGCPLFPPRLELGPELGELPRVDLRGLEAWAIDNAWSSDPDDAVSWDGEAVWVHVADPAAVILPGSPVDEEAFGRGATLYLPESTVPMLPAEAVERFGLGLAPESPALSFKIRLADDASLASVEVMASTLEVRRSHYEEADRIVETGAEGAEGLRALARIAEIRRQRRLAQGAMEIDIPEVRVFVRDGTIRIEALPDTRSSLVVRELMLLAGEAAARWAFERNLAFPFYGQEAPGEAGSLPSGLAGEFAKRRLMRAGISGPTPSAHRGLGLPFYAQATSPLRRYQDLLGHMQIRAVLAGRKPLDADEVGRRSALAQAAAAPNRQAERASELHWTLAYLLRNPDWEGEGIIVGQAGPASQVYLPSLGLETKLKLGSGRALNEVLRLRVSRVELAGLEVAFSEV